MSVSEFVRLSAENRRGGEAAGDATGAGGDHASLVAGGATGATGSARVGVPGAAGAVGGVQPRLSGSPDAPLRSGAVGSSRVGAAGAVGAVGGVGPSNASGRH